MRETSIFVATTLSVITALLFASALCGWLGSEALDSVDKRSLVSIVFKGILGFVLSVLGLPAMLANGVIAAVLGAPVTQYAGWQKEVPAWVFFENIWYLIPISLIAWIPAAMPKAQASVSFAPLLAVFFPSKEARRQRDKYQAKRAKVDTERAEKASELDDILAELELAERELKQRQKPGD